MSVRRYGPSDGRPIAFSEYHQSKDDLASLPETTVTQIPVTNTPNIFSYRSHVFARNPAHVGLGGLDEPADQLGFPGEDV